MKNITKEKTLKDTFRTMFLKNFIKSHFFCDQALKLGM